MRPQWYSVQHLGPPHLFGLSVGHASYLLRLLVFCACLLSLFAQKYIIPVVALPRGSRRAANTDKTASPRAQSPPVTFNIKSATYTSGRILRFASMVDAK